MAKQPDQPEHDFPRGIGSPATSALLFAGYTRLEQLTTRTEQEILALHGVGPKAIAVLRGALAEHGWTFASAERK